MIRNLIERLTTKKKTASIAKERLQIIISHEQMKRNAPDFLPMLQKDLIAVIAKYVEIDAEQVKVDLEKHGDHSILELNITLPENAKLEDIKSNETVKESEEETVS